MPADESSVVTLCLLGPAAISDGNDLQQLQLRPKAIALLGWLALVPGRQLRSELAGMLFSDAEEPRRSLRWHLNHLRGALPEALRPCLHVGTEWLSFGGPTDVAAFAHAARRVADSPSDPDAADVLAMYRGDLMAGVAVSASPAFETWLYVEQERLRRDFGAAARSYARWAIETDRAERALEPLARLVTVDPYLEDGWVLLVQAYQAAGKPSGCRRGLPALQGSTPPRAPCGPSVGVGCPVRVGAGQRPDPSC